MENINYAYLNSFRTGLRVYYVQVLGDWYEFTIPTDGCDYFDIPKRISVKDCAEDIDRNIKEGTFKRVEPPKVELR